MKVSWEAWIAMCSIEVRLSRLKNRRGNSVSCKPAIIPLSLSLLTNPARSAEAFAVRIAVSKGARTKNMGNSTVGEKHSARSLEPSSDSSSDTEDEYADAEETFDESLYAEGEHPDELREQQRRLRRARGEDTSSGMQGKMVKTKKGDRDVKKPMSEKERKKAEGKEAKRKRDAMIGCVAMV